MTTMEEVYKAEVLCLRKTLKEIIDENEKLRKIINELNQKILLSEGGKGDVSYNTPKKPENS